MAELLADSKSGFVILGMMMATITGTAIGDILYGTALNDIINGLGGDDLIQTGDGYDGGYDGGIDTVHGGDGNDRIGSTNTFAPKFRGNLFGDGGNDVIYTTAYYGATMVDGGTGDDRLFLGLFSVYTPNAITAFGGDGNDLVMLGGGQASTVDMGAGDDRFISIEADSQTVTLGAGRDELVYGFQGRGSTDLDDGLVNYSFYSGGSRLTVTDFKPGEDRITFNITANYPGSQSLNPNPFADGCLRIEQRGADAVLAYDVNYGSGNAPHYSEMITFKNLDGSLLTAAELDGYDPGGGKVIGRVITGTDASQSGPADLMLRAAGLVGTQGADTIYGLAGDDDLIGRAGNDALYGGAGNDHLVGGLGSDLLHGGDGNDTLEGGRESDKAYGEGGDDTLIGALVDGKTSVIDGGAGKDKLVVDLSIASFADNVKGTLTVRGGTGADVIVVTTWPEGYRPPYFAHRGQTVNVWLGGGADTFYMTGGAIGQAAPIVVHDWQAGIDVIDPNFWSADQISVRLTNYVAGSNPYADGHAKLVQVGADTVLYIDPNGGGNSYFQSIRFIGTDRAIFAGAGLGAFDFTVDPAQTAVPTVTGTDGDDTLSNGLVQHLPTGGGFNTIGTGGAFAYAGGKGDDYYMVDFLEKVIEKPGEGYDRITLWPGPFGAADSYTIPENVEGLSLVYSITSIKIIGNALDNTIGLNASQYLGAQNGNQVVEAGAGKDTVDTGFGNDWLDGGTGDDTLTGMAGDDTYLIDSVGDQIFETNGTADGIDTVRTTLASYTLGDALESLVYTGTANAALTGNAANNRLSGNSGNDVIDGGAGQDTADYSQAAQAVRVNLAASGAQNTQGAGLDTLVSIENLVGSRFADTLTGTGGSNRLEGGGGADAMFGAGGKDVLIGGGGADRLYGGLGNDVLVGGTGADKFVFDTALQAGGFDTINDFHAVQGDSLILRLAIFVGIGATGALSGDAFYDAAGATTAHDASDRILYDTTSGTLRFDSDGTGSVAAIAFAILKGAPTLSHADIMVI